MEWKGQRERQKERERDGDERVEWNDKKERETSKSTTTSFPLLALDGQLHKISTHVFN